MRWDRITLSQALIVAGLLWLALLWLWPAALQSHVFYRDGTEAFWDYRLPQACVASPNVYEPEGISRVDAP